jgi:hypothetical protein
MATPSSQTNEGAGTAQSQTGFGRPRVHWWQEKDLTTFRLSVNADSAICGLARGRGILAVSHFRSSLSVFMVSSGRALSGQGSGTARPSVAPYLDRRVQRRLGKGASPLGSRLRRWGERTREPRCRLESRIPCRLGRDASPYHWADRRRRAGKANRPRWTVPNFRSPLVGASVLASRGVGWSRESGAGSAGTPRPTIGPTAFDGQAGRIGLDGPSLTSGPRWWGERTREPSPSSRLRLCRWGKRRWERRHPCRRWRAAGMPPFPVTPRIGASY